MDCLYSCLCQSLANLHYCDKKRLEYCDIAATLALEFRMLGSNQTFHLRKRNWQVEVPKKSIIAKLKFPVLWEAPPSLGSDGPFLWTPKVQIVHKSTYCYHFMFVIFVFSMRLQVMWGLFALLCVSWCLVLSVHNICFKILIL
jgi:hypothetical protein